MLVTFESTKDYGLNSNENPVLCYMYASNLRMENNHVAACLPKRSPCTITPSNVCFSFWWEVLTSPILLTIASETLMTSNFPVWSTLDGNFSPVMSWVLYLKSAIQIRTVANHGTRDSFSQRMRKTLHQKLKCHFSEEKLQKIALKIADHLVIGWNIKKLSTGLITLNFPELNTNYLTLQIIK